MLGSTRLESRIPSIGTTIPGNWYRTSVTDDIKALFFEQDGEEAARLAVQMLGARSGERVLELACASGRRALELARMGLDVIGVDIHNDLLAIGGIESEEQGLSAYFAREDPRYIEFDSEFDLALSLGGGAFEHFDYDAEIERAFAAAARALRPGGRLLMQMPNLLHVRAHLPEHARVETEEVVEVIDQEWSEPIHRLDGERTTLILEEEDEHPEPVPFQRRIYSVEELAEAFERTGLRLTDVFDEQGRRCCPTDAQQQLFVEARRV